MGVGDTNFFKQKRTKKVIWLRLTWLVWLFKKKNLEKSVRETLIEVFSWK